MTIHNESPRGRIRAACTVLRHRAESMHLTKEAARSARVITICSIRAGESVATAVLRGQKACEQFAKVPGFVRTMREPQRPRSVRKALARLMDRLSMEHAGV